MTTLNAYDERVQHYINTHKTTSHKTYTNERMQQFKEHFRKKERTFEAHFPKKLYKGLTKLLIMLSKTGITKISAERFAKKVNCSVRTITKLVSVLKKDTQILVGRLKSSTKNNGHYIFVDKTNCHFHEIMTEVFNNPSINNAEQNAEPIAEQENAETPIVPSDSASEKGVKEVKGFNKHTNNIYNIYKESAVQSAILTAVEDSPIETLAQQENYIQEYAVCPAQSQLFHLIQSLESMLLPCIMQKAHVIALRIGSNAQWKDVVIARDVLLTITENTNNHVYKEAPTYKTILATFTERFNYKRTHYVPEAKKRFVGTATVSFTGENANWLKDEFWE